MNEKMVSQITEAIKTIKFDGTLNSQTLTEIVKTVAPYYKFYLIKDCVMDVFWGVTLIIIVTVISNIK